MSVWTDTRGVAAAASLAFLLAGCPQFTAPPEETGARPPSPAQATQVRVEPRRAPNPAAGAARPSGTEGDAPTSVSARHILVQYQGSMRAGPTVTRTKDEARTRIDDVLRRARQPGADFAALAREFSDGPSGPRGGDLGEFSRGRMHPDFERASFELASGAVSDVVETPFGFHVIQRYR